MKLLGLEHETATAIYEQTNRRVEKVADIFFVGFVKVLPTCVFLATFLLSFIKYFTTDLGGDAFELPVLGW